MKILRLESRQDDKIFMFTLHTIGTGVIDIININGSADRFLFTKENCEKLKAFLKE